MPEKNQIFDIIEADERSCSGMKQWSPSTTNTLLKEEILDAWQEDLVTSLKGSTSVDDAFQHIENAAKSLGFDYYAYSARAPYPLSSPKTFICNNYPMDWKARYVEKSYLSIAPSALHGPLLQEPMIRDDQSFVTTPKLWDETQTCSLKVEWAQSSLGANGAEGMLTLARPNNPLSTSELASNQFKMQWLAHITHQFVFKMLLQNCKCAQRIDSRLTSREVEMLRWTVDGKLLIQSCECEQRHDVKLTPREVEVLRWTADGKSSADIADILSLATDTINFHIKNAIRKLDTPNKTAAVAKAALLGFLC